MSSGKRLLWVVLLLTIVAALWPVPENGSVDAVATRPSAARKLASVRDTSPTRQLGSLTSANPAREREIVDLFPRQSYTPPAANAAPEKPTAPELPFSYGGRYTEGGNVLVFLKGGDKIHTVRLGDIVNASYRVEKIAPEAITLTYLPLGLQQTLQTGSTIRP